MLIDKNAQLCDNATVTATVANAIIGDVYDTGSVPTLKDIGLGAKQMFLVISVDTAVTSNGSATVQFTLLSDSTADLTTSATTHITSIDIPKASLTAGAQFIYPLPPGSYERYMGLFANTKVQTLNAGKVSAYLTLDPPKFTALPDAL